MQRRRVLIYSTAALGVTGATLLAGWWRVDGPGAPAPVGRRPLDLPQMQFEMTDHTGAPVGPASLAGRASLVLFGFTYCPAVCPTTLSDISGWLDDLGADASQLNVVFITVDPDRDTVDAVAEYVGYFHPAIEGWIGTPAQLDKAAEDFRVRYEKVATGEGDYTMNHAATVFAFDAGGEFVSTIDYHEPREFAVPKIRRALDNTTKDNV